MKSSTVRELERLLAATPAGTPPPGLADRIKSEIPAELAAPALPDAPPRPAVWQAHRWRLAAALLMVLGGGSLAWWTIRDAGVPGPPVVQDAEAERADVPGGKPAPPDETGSVPESTPPAPAASEPRAVATTQAGEGADSAARPRPERPRRQPMPDTARQTEPQALRSLGYLDAEKPSRKKEGAEARADETPTATFYEELAVAGKAPVIDATPTTAGARFSDKLNELPVTRTFSGSAYMAPGVPGGGSTSEGTSAAPSTGGTAEPNDAPYGDMFFKHYGVNPFLDPEEDRLSTFALDVDTGSWGVVRRYLDGGDLPPAEAVRVEEMVNALDYGDEAPSEGDFALHAEGAPTPFGGGDRYRLLRFAIQAREVSAADRKPAALTFVIDVSGSMGQQNRLGLVKASLGLLLGELRPDDRVALVVYGSRGRVVLAPTADKEALLAAIDGLHPEGATNAEEGLTLGYRLASEALRPGAINRVVLASDGVANVGATGPDSILATVRAEAAHGIELTTLGFGMGNYNDVLMERLADEGDGRYAYIDTLDEARRVLVEELTGTLQTIAEEARAQVEINPEVVERYRLLGYENRDIADERFRDDTVDAGEIGAGHTVTALYEVKLREAATGRAGARAYRHAPVATLRLRWRPDGADAFVETERPLTVGELARSWESATPALRLAGLAAELAELLRGSYWARGGSLDTVVRGLQQLQPELAGDSRAAELTAMAGKAARLEAEQARAEAEADPGS